MRVRNIRLLDNLNTYASLAGVFNIFIGLLIVFLDVMNEDWTHIQVGIYVFITGYAFVKVSQKIGFVVLDEKKILAEIVLKDEKVQELRRLTKEQRDI